MWGRPGGADVKGSPGTLLCRADAPALQEYTSVVHNSIKYSDSFCNDYLATCQPMWSSISVANLKFIGLLLFQARKGAFLGPLAKSGCLLVCSLWASAAILAEPRTGPPYLVG